jgi:hypothetical protein
MRHVTNREYGQECEWCHGKIEVGEECIQSQSVGMYNRKWHLDCTPQQRYYRFGNDMNKPYTKEILRRENENNE